MVTVNTGKCELGFISPHRIYEGQTFPGWEQIGFTDELTEGDCLVIIDSVAGFKFNDFNSDKGICYDWSLSSAKESFNSLLTANHITGRQIVLRKIEHK